MFRIPAFFMATLLFFSMMLPSSAQQISVQAQAEADALKDIDQNMKKEVLFTLGLVGSGAGFVTGCAGGCLLGTFIDADSGHFIFNDPVTSCGIAGSILLGVLAVPAAVFTYPHNPNPPPERLLGKSPEYIEVYTQVYRSKTISLRKRLVTAGSFTSNLGVVGMILLFIISDS